MSPKKNKNQTSSQSNEATENKAVAETEKQEVEQVTNSDLDTKKGGGAEQDSQKEQDSKVEKDSAKSEESSKSPKEALAKSKEDKDSPVVADAEDTPINDDFSARIIVVTSGKGGVGKTTTAASISTGLASKGHKTVVVDFDVGLRNLDLIMGCERRVVYDFINVLNGEARLNQALIKDKHVDNLYILAASQTKDKDSLSYAGVGKVLKELSDMGFEYIICDSPAGIEAGALIALYYADAAIVTTNPEISSLRDSDRILGILYAKSRRAVNNKESVDCKLLLTRYDVDRVTKKDMISLEDINSLLRIPVLGVIPESKEVLKCSNDGIPVILNQKCDAGKAYQDAVERLLGKEMPLRFTTEKTFFQKIFG